MNLPKTSINTPELVKIPSHLAFRPGYERKCMYLRLSVITATLVLATSGTFAADWPQWRGPDRNEVSKETGIRTKFGANGPKVLWSVENLGRGYSAPAVVGNVLYILGAEDSEFAAALNTATGKEIWRTPLGDKYKNGYGDGPRSTTTFDGDRLYFVRGDGSLHCLDANTGKEIWKKQFKQDFKGQLMSGWGFSESPLIDGDHLICTPGGRDGSIICLNKSDGSTVWRCKEVTDAAAYASIIAADVDGVHQYIQVLHQGIAGVRASDGKLLWYYDRPGKTATVPTAIYHDHHVYVTAGYNVGCDMFKLTKDGEEFKTEKVYSNQNLVNHHGGVVLLDGFIYGHSYQGPNKGWVCQEFLTGKIKWTSDGKGGPGKGSLTYAAGHLFCYDEKTGNLHIAEASPKAWKETGVIKLPKKSSDRFRNDNCWTHPVIANGKLYLRDQDLLFCFDVKQ
jgi:outer membrane protein assembly factor BamB